MIRPVIGSIFALSVLALVGCGSDSTTQTVTVGGGEALTKAELIEQADAICAAARDELDAITTELKLRVESGDDNPGDLASIYREAGDSTQSEIEQLRELEPPPADQEIINSMLATADTEIGQIEEFADAMESRDQAETEALAAKIDASAAKAKGIVQGYGFKVCGSER